MGPAQHQRNQRAKKYNHRRKFKESNNSYRQRQLNESTSRTSSSPEESSESLPKFGGLKTKVVPLTYKDAVKGADSGLWREAIRRETASILANNTFREVVALPGVPAVKGKWVFEILPNGTYRARLTIKGFHHVRGIGYEQIHVPLVNHDAVRVAFSIAGYLGMKIHHLIVNDSSLYGEFRENIYMEIPDGFRSDNPDVKYFQLGQPLYGIQRAPLAWNLRMKETLNSLGFTQSPESCLHHKLFGTRLMMILLSYDDMLVMCSDESRIFEFREAFGRVHDVAVMGPAKTFLGINITHTSEGITLSMKDFIESTLRMDGHLEEPPRPCFGPYFENWEQKLIPHISDEYFDKPELYRNMIRALHIASLTIRFDITFITNALTKYSHRPLKKHVNVLVRVLRYLRNTSDFSLLYKRKGLNQNFPKLTGYCGSEWGDRERQTNSSSKASFC